MSAASADTCRRWPRRTVRTISSAYSRSERPLASHTDRKHQAVAVLSHRLHRVHQEGARGAALAVQPGLGICRAAESRVAAVLAPIVDKLDVALAPRNALWSRRVVTGTLILVRDPLAVLERRIALDQRAVHCEMLVAG
jgi:hypothetical protein